MIRYEWRGEKTELVFTPHGNQKKADRQFIRSKKHLIQDLKTSKRSSAHKVMNEFNDKERKRSGVVESLTGSVWEMLGHVN